MFTSLKRAIILGSKNFYRSMGISVATIFIVSAAVFLISVLFIFNLAANIVIDSVKQKVDISVYFIESAKTEDILATKAELLKIPEVKNVEYITKEQALDEFTSKHKDEQDLIDSLSEIGRNPFLASLNISVKDSSKYQQIVDFLNGDNYRDKVERVDYFQRKSVIDRLYSISDSINKGGMILGIILGLVAVLVAFNAIRVAIYASKEEISVMRLVGASNWFIRGPFIIQGIIAGFISFIVAFFAIFWLCYGFNSSIRQIAPEISPFKIFIANFWILIIIQMVSGICIAMISTVAAIRKYLKV